MKYYAFVVVKLILDYVCKLTIKGWNLLHIVFPFCFAKYSF